MTRSSVLLCVVFFIVTVLNFYTSGFIFADARRRPFLRTLSDILHALQIKRRNLLQTSRPDCSFPANLQCDPDQRYRSADGYCNNLDHPSWGSPGWPFRRMLSPKYDDGKSEPRMNGKNGPLPSAREVSRILHTDDSPDMRSFKLTSMFTQFGQFLDHDISLTPKTKDPTEIDCCEQEIQFPVRGIYVEPKQTATSFMAKSRPLSGTCFPISIPQPDPNFNNSCMNFVRSKVFSPTFKCRSTVREQGNAISSFIDASMVYGTTETMQKGLRMKDGGWLTMSGVDLLPRNDSTTCRATRFTGGYCFGSGDVRVNEQPMLSALHVVFHRYHNYIAMVLSNVNTHWSSEKTFQETRKIIGGILQHIVYTEYLPLVIGPHFMRAYSLSSTGIFIYDKNADPRVMNAFATAAFRFGHSMVPGHLMFGNTQKPLESMYFDPRHIQDNDGTGLSSLIQGTISDFSQKSDRFFSPAVSKHLFKDGARSLDLVSLNIQRGRDHGLPPYNDFREACGLPKVTKTSGLNMPFMSVYNDPDDIDLFSGGMGEKHVPGGVVGDTFACIIARQFKDLKYGDRFFYETLNRKIGFTLAQLHSIKTMTLSSILCEVSGIKNSQRNVFKAVSDSNPLVPCKDITQLDVMAWIDK